jgi:hypothetical protein
MKYGEEMPTVWAKTRMVRHFFVRTSGTEKEAIIWYSEKFIR